MDKPKAVLFDAYGTLFADGHAHSVEVWRDGRRVDVRPRCAMIAGSPVQGARATPGTWWSLPGSGTPAGSKSRSS